MPAAQGEELSPRLGDPSLLAFVGANYTKSYHSKQGGRNRETQKRISCGAPASDILIDFRPPSFGGGFFCAHFRPFRHSAGGVFVTFDFPPLRYTLRRTSPARHGAAWDSTKPIRLPPSLRLRRDGAIKTGENQMKRNNQDAPGSARPSGTVGTDPAGSHGQRSEPKAA